MPRHTLRPSPAAAPVVVLIALLVLLTARAAAAPDVSRHAPFPSPDAGYVSDFASALDAAQEQQLEEWILRAEQRSGVQLVVVTIERMAAYPETPRTIEAFATALFDRWQIGNMPRNDGVLLLLSLRDRKARIELGAHYGHSRNAEATRIMDNIIVPRFRDGDYPGGIEAGVQAILTEFAGVRTGYTWPLIASLVAIPISALIAYSLIRNGQRGWGWVVLGLLVVAILAVIFLLRIFLREVAREGSDNGSWSGGGSFGGGGFGGGFSGGGGASGSW